MDESPTRLGTGCLICLVQASDSMRDAAFTGPVATKIAAAHRVVNGLINDLVLFLADGVADSPQFEVGVFAYSTRPDGQPRLRPLLPGSGGDRLLVPVRELSSAATASVEEDAPVWIESKPSGEAPARAALMYTRGLLTRWVAAHPGASPPVLVHFTDGDTSDGCIGGDVEVLNEAIPGLLIVHCLFRRGDDPSAFVPVPESLCGNLWAMSSLYPSDGTAEPGAPTHRWMFVNKLSAARTIGQLVRRLWSRPTPPVPETPPEEAVESPVDGSAEPEPASETEPAPESPAPEHAGPPRFELRALWTPKRGNSENEWEDGFDANPAGGVLAVADGASDGIFTKLWVELLLKSYLAQPVPLDDLAAVEPWIQEQRRAWFTAIRYPEQRWSIQLKIDRSCGAATFLGFRLDPPPTDQQSPAEAIGWTAWVVGDICLFHIRGGNPIGSFPISGSAEFNVMPQLYQSKAMRPTPPALATRGDLLPGDLIVFATDAMAQRLFVEVESTTPPDWNRFWDLDPEIWRREIEAFRDQNAIVNDDCTLLLLRLPTPAADASGESRPEHHGEPSAFEPSMATDAVTHEIAPTVEQTSAFLEPEATSEPIAPAVAEVCPVDVEIDSGNLPTEPHSFLGGWP